MDNFIFDIKTKVYFGKDTLKELWSEILNKTDRVLLCYGSGSIKNNGIYDQIILGLKENNIFYKELTNISPNPDIESVDEGVKICREHNLTGILAVGGGSVIDTAKVISAGVNKEYSDPWEIMKKGERNYALLPVFTVTTLSATGSEMNAVSVMTNKKLKLKQSTITAHPVCSIIDPTFTNSVPKIHLIAGVVDIISHTLEDYFSLERDSYLLDGFSISIIKTCIKYGKVLLTDPTNYEAKANLAWASTYAINGVIAHGKPHAWTFHVISHPITHYYGLTHGLTFSILMPHWMEYVLNEQRVEPFYRLGVEVFGIDKNLPKMEVAKQTIEEFKNFFKLIGAPLKFSEVGVDDRHFNEIVENLNITANERRFVPFDKQDVLNILRSALWKR